MLAKIPLNLPEEEMRPAPPSFTATFNPNSAAQQFSFSDGNGNVANLVLIDDSTQTITITLIGATFADIPIVWVLRPTGTLPEIVLVHENTLRFTVPQPVHVLSPWAFGIVVNTPDVLGVRSQTIYLARSHSGVVNSWLTYNGGNGLFSLSDDNSQPVFNVESQVFLVSASLPSNPPTFSLNLASVSLPPGFSITFAASPIVWSSGSQPEWIDLTPSPTAVMMKINPSGAGQFIGFQFAIEITTTAGKLAVLSPDPILVNTTIGDG